MAEESNNKSAAHETQKQRWLKYGLNVVLASVVVIGIAAALAWLSQRYNGRLDTTSLGLYSLKPQTVNVIKENSQPIKLVSLYTKVKPEEINAEGVKDFATPVADLLDEYRRKGRNFDVEIIDPDSQPSKVDALIEEVTNKYGGEVKKYREFVNDFMPRAAGAATTQAAGIYGEFRALAEKEVEEFKNTRTLRVEDRDLLESLDQIVQTVQDFPERLERSRQEIDRRLKQRPPDYKGAVDRIERAVSDLSQDSGALLESFRKAKDDKKANAELKDFIARATPRYELIKSRADAVLKRIKGLGELKLDDLRTSLRQSNSILVLGQDEMRTIPFEKVWQVPMDARGFSPEGKPKPRFAGEQQVTSAVLSLSKAKRTKVAFLRPGGPPLASAGNLFQPGGPFSTVAQRLRDANFEVIEKDLSGMWAMQQQMQGGAAAPEPSDEEIKDAVWVVINVPSQQGPMAAASAVGPKLKAHLDRGGSALILSELGADSLAATLDSTGIRLQPRIVAVHEAIRGPGNSNDMIERAQAVPYIFVVKDFGQHPLASPLRSIDGVFIMASLVTTEASTTWQTTPLLPVPQDLKVWGESDVETLMGKGDVSFDKGKGDVAAPLFLGAAAQSNDGKSRLVAIGSAKFALDGLVAIPDPELEKQRIVVSRFPGNAELFVNAVHWLARQDTMLAIGPSALEVSRVDDIRPAMLSFLRAGLLLIILPGAVILAGIVTYFRRMD